MNNEFNQWIQEHKVCFEVAPLLYVQNSTLRQTGFELHLFAQHNGNNKVNPSGTEAYDLYRQLQRVAQTATAANEQPCRCEILPYDFSYRMRLESRLKPEVQLAILVVHHENFFEGVDQSQVECVNEIQGRLTRMGAQPHVWR